MTAETSNRINMNAHTDTSANRIRSIDTLRGIVMVVMALDHVRDFFHITANTADPLDLETTTPGLFFTRWITHFCAPVFVFLAGTSIFLQGIRKPKNELSRFIITRGLWLILIELTVVNFAWTFNPEFNFLVLQVIWAIGISMVILGLLIHLPLKLIFWLGLLIVLGHNLLDFEEASPNYHSTFIMDLLHHAHFTAYELFPDHFILIIYPFLPWLGLMMLGYCFGKWYKTGVTQEQRKKLLVRTGIILIAVFCLVRGINFYGDPEHWAEQPNTFSTVLSFINITKYPPSLLYLCIMMGPAMLILAALEGHKSWLADKAIVFGRVAFFYYIIHLFVIHFLCAVSFFMRGHTMNEAFNLGEGPPFYFVIPGEGFSLPGVYATYFLVILILYPACRMYTNYKTSHRNWWLSYL